MSRWTRRACLLSAAAALSGCRLANRTAADGRTDLTFLAWGDGDEWRALESAVATYHSRQNHVRVHLEQVSYKFEERLEVRLAAGAGPDLFRVSYINLGRFTPGGALIDLSPWLPADLATHFDSVTWSAVQYRGKPHAVPYHSDTSALVCNREVLKRAGVRTPDSAGNAWTWDEFVQISRRIRDKKLTEFAFGMNWTFGGAFRWLNFLYQHQGQLLRDDLLSSAIDSPEALDTLHWTRNWFDERLTPASASTKTGGNVHQLWLAGVVAMQFDVGVNELRLFPPSSPWDVTFCIRDRQNASELGGTAIG
ncbi:MAG: extracellular solute-binding protein, partial [Bryobacteraceae bacterium]|nr:extracellular solute-binding protein [Bryobacteraceae bacterium]